MVKHSTRRRLLGTGLVLALLGFGLSRAWIWAFDNFRLPESDMGPLSGLSNATADDLNYVRVSFPDDDGVEVRLKQYQLRILAEKYCKGPHLKLINHFGDPYAVTVSRTKDTLAKHGYSYTWTIHDWGDDRKLGTVDDITLAWYGRP